MYIYIYTHIYIHKYIDAHICIYKCICIYNNIGALNTTIGDRGVAINFYNDDKDIYYRKVSELVINLINDNDRKNDLKKSISQTVASSKDLTIKPPQLRQKPPNKSKIYPGILYKNCI